MRKLTCRMKKLIVCALICSVVVSVFAERLYTDKYAFLDSVSGIMVVKAATKDKKTELPLKIYKKIKGWWTDNSSGGYNRKVKKKYIKVYDRATGKLAYKSKIYGWKNTRQGYLIKLKYPHNNAKYCYLYNEPYAVLEYYDSWDIDGKNYSGSASMERIE